MPALKIQRSYWSYLQYQCHIFETRHTTKTNLQPQNNIKPILHLLWLQISRFVLGLKIYQHYVFRWTIGVFKVFFFFCLSVCLPVSVRGLWKQHAVPAEVWRGWNKSPGAGETGGMGASNWTPVLCKSSALSYPWAISQPQLEIFLLV